MFNNKALSVTVNYYLLDRLTRRRRQIHTTTSVLLTNQHATGTRVLYPI